MVDVSLRVILLIGLIVLSIGLLMPAENTERYPYASSGPEQVTTTNPWKIPLTIVGIGLTAYAGLGYKNHLDDDSSAATD